MLLMIAAQRSLFADDAGDPGPSHALVAGKRCAGDRSRRARKAGGSAHSGDDRCRNRRRSQQSPRSNKNMCTGPMGPSARLCSPRGRLLAWRELHAYRVAWRRHDLAETLLLAEQSEVAVCATGTGLQWEE
jgi:hypothetical protein